MFSLKSIHLLHAIYEIRSIAPIAPFVNLNIQWDVADKFIIDMKFTVCLFMH